MTWRLYKKDDPNTWPQIDCPMLVYLYHANGDMNLWICKWNKDKKWFIRDEMCNFFTEECYYAYIGYIPSGYKTTYPAKCTRDDRCGYDDDGYCMLEAENQHCEFAKTVPEYSIEEKRIWKEFE